MDNNQTHFTPETGNRERALSPSSIRQQELQQQSEALAKDFRALMESKASAIRAIRSVGSKAPLASKLADDLIAEVDHATPTLLRLAARDGGFDVRDERDIAEFRAALETMRAFMSSFKENFEERFEPIHQAVREHSQRQAEAQVAAQEAQAGQLARGMDSSQALKWLEVDQNCRLRLTKKGDIELAPAGRANEMRIRAMIRLHAEGLKELLAARQSFAIVDLG